MAKMTKVLLLDDDENARVLQSTILESDGYEVITAVNGKEGLERLEEVVPDIIISDILMPEMDGFEFGMQVKRDDRFKEIPFVFYSAQYTDEQDQALVEQIGADRFIIKPIEMGDFLAIIKEVLEGYGTQATDQEVVKSSEEEGEFDREHYRAQARMLDKKLHELEEEHEKMRLSEAKYRRLLEGLSSNYFIYRHDSDGIFTYVSPTVTEMLGYSCEEFQTHFDAYFTDNPINKLASEYTQKGLRGEQTPSYELELYTKDGSIRSLQVSEQTLFDANGNVVGIEGIARNITMEKEAEAIKEESDRKLHDALVDMIRVIALTVEKRDPYTAGHQQRVAEIAVAIGEKMELDAARLEGLRLGALIHDIGKITIPAEILTNPGHLSDIEYTLIQSHAAEGYDILRDIEFPWPLSQMVLQHHERIDGSGYPNGLKSEEILLEAKILCVADVVEAMTSDRPYRPGLGFDAAIEEITKHRGMLYDEEIVDHCIELFKGGSFTFAGDADDA
ncbi:MAG: response regulator [Sulfurimonadaceae bacterium]|nr:response regulator [Sulfurimonadaceae bacterium]